MILKHLQLTHFKNHDEASFDFADRINCILGMNGTGKTNLLDAIYYLSFTKSALNPQDRYSIAHDAQAFTVFGQYDKVTIAVQSEKRKTKSLKIDGQAPEKLSEVIGKVPTVLVLPDDASMIREGGEERRKFFDGALSQFDRDYLEKLIQYNRLLKQRNSLLKQNDGLSIDYKLVETYDDQLIPLATAISEARANAVEVFLPYLEKNYQSLHDGGETPGLLFQTQVHEDFEKVFKQNFQKDQWARHTTLGAHRDDFQFILDGGPIKKFGSQGQQKTFIIAMKLALYDFLVGKTQKKPLLLLDDIFDKLDDSRIEQLVQLLIDGKRFGQVFITDARKDRSKLLFEGMENVKFIEIAK